MISKKKVITLLLVACVMVGGVFLIKQPKGDEGTREHREYTVGIGDIIVGIDGAGEVKLAATEQYFAINGTVEEIGVKKGQKVNEGDFIAKLCDKRTNTELEELRLDLSGKEYSLTQLKKQRDSIKDVNSQEYISLQSQVRTAQIEVDKVYNKIDDLEYELENLYVYANKSGVITEVGYEVGAEVTTSKPIVTIGDETNLYFDVLVSQTDIIGINEEQEVIVTLESYPDVEINGNVIEKGYVNATQGDDVDYKVRVSLESNGLELYQGMTGEIKFIIKGKEDVIQIPNKFIYIKDNKQLVKVLENNEIKEREIRTGFSDGKLTEIVEGLQSGEIVVEER